MPSPNSVFQSIGGLSFPITGVTDSLSVLDPGRVVMTALFKAAINDEWNEAWTAVTTTLDAGHPLIGTDPVADTLEVEPTPQIMQQRKAVFPLLCVYRHGEATYEQQTLQDEQLSQEWGVDYILGPLDVGDYRKLGDICVGVGKLLRIVIQRRSHNSYESGAIQFGPGKGDFGSASLASQQGPGQASFAGDEAGTLYYAISFKLKTTEMSSSDIGGSPPFDAANVSVGVGNETEIVPDLLQADTSTYREG